MKVVINRCYGGFGISPEAQKLYLKYCGKKCYFYKQTKYEHCDGKVEYMRVPTKEATSWCYTVTKNLGKTTTDIGGDNESELWYDGNIERDDPILIRVVEELGSDKASNSHAKLEIVEIPDGIEYTIDDYDGRESIHEAHRSW